jgi:putative transcriptional regulator
VQNNVAELRSARGWTQADLGRALDVSRQTVISIEKGKYDPSLPLAFKIAALFGLKVEDVFIP